MTALEEATVHAGREVPPAVKLVELTKRYNGRTRNFTLSPNKFVNSLILGRPWETLALNKVNFSVDHGEVFGLLGPNGSGKTTLIKILSNLVIPDGGAAYVEGINVVRNPYATSARLQTVLSDPLGMERRISARQNLALFASLYDLPKSEADEKINRLLDYFGLQEYADKSSQSLSTGTSRKLTVCRVLLSDASIIIFDEPTSGLDPTAADNFRRLIIEDLVKREKKTIIMATHNLAEAVTMCTRIALLNHGGLLAVGTPEEIRRRVEDRVDVAITVAGGAASLDDLRLKLEKVDGIHSVEMVDAPGIRKIRLTGRKDLGYPEALALISGAGLKVQSLETSSLSLEDAFLRLTREGNQ